MKIFLDFDGTLIDSRQRLYYLFQRLVPNSKLSFEEYWVLKRNGNSHELLFKRFFPTNDYEMFEQSWMQLIETKEFLDLDFPYVNVSGYLANLKKDNNLYLVTSRQFIEGVVYQLKRFEWDMFFDDVLVTKQKFRKEDLVKSVMSPGEKGCMIGDTGKDIQTAKNLGLFSVGVYSGFLSREILVKYQPDILKSCITEFNLEELNSVQYM